jgi:hypothetical protein
MPFFVTPFKLGFQIHSPLKPSIQVSVRQTATQPGPGWMATTEEISVMNSGLFPMMRVSFSRYTPASVSLFACTML